MALDPISPLTRLPAVRNAVQVHLERAATPNPAQTLRLLLGAGAAGELLARSEQGHIYQLAATGEQAQWRAGQTLLVQVLRTGPPLEVRLLGLVPAAGMVATGLADVDGVEPPAVRPDQAAILHLAAATNDAMVQAAHWRQLSLMALRVLSTVVPAHSTLATPAEAGAVASSQDPALLLRQLPWHGLHLTLWLERRGWNGGANRRARSRPGSRLCLTLELPRWGRVGLVLDVSEVRVGLTLIVNNAKTVPELQAQATAIGARIARAGLRLMRCQVLYQPHYKAPTTQAASVALAEHELPLALFRAGAEVLEALRRTAD